MTHITQYDIDKLPEVNAILEKAQQDIEQIAQVQVSVYYRIKQEHLPTQDLIKIITDVCEVSWHHVLSSSRKIELVIARHLFCHFSLYTQKKTPQCIADFIGRDRTSVLHARDNVATMLETKQELWLERYNEAERRINCFIIRKKTAAV